MFGDEYIPDYNDLYAMHEARQERALRKYPKCADCEEHITDDYLFNINGVFYCEECAEDNFRRSTDDYIS